MNEDGVSHKTRSNSSKGFAITVAILSLSYNTLAVTLCRYLPDDPLYIGYGITAYAWLGGLLSLVGLMGILLHRPVLITSFAHYLLLDTFMAALSRMLVLELFIDGFSTDDFCSNGSRPRWRQQWQQNEGLSHRVVTSTEWAQQEAMGSSLHGHGCSVALGVVQLVLLALLVCTTAAQGMLAVGMRRYSREMEWARHGAVVLLEVDGAMVEKHWRVTP